ncbi:MAG: 3-hydroxyacyl-CoA dehydrogenase NAD-binding domain-containing protein, partial [Pseudomonadota bacterium]
VGNKAIVSSNTSGLPIAELVAGRSPDFRRRFLVTHFFNPVRYMKLLELVAGTETDPQVVERVARFAEDVLGKGVVRGKDTPNFIANRIGVYSLLLTIHEMLESGLNPEDVDAIVGEPMGRPRSAAFRTADMVGLDTFVHVADNCHAALVSDEQRDVFSVPPYVRAMIEARLLGDKTKAGFYRKTGDTIETLDPRTGQYRPKQTTAAVAAAIKAPRSIEDPGKRLRALVADPGPAGAFAWKVQSRVLAYAARRLGEIADKTAAIDDAMRWGYNWSLGPFEAWDALGFAETLARMEKDGLALPDWVLRMRDAGATGFYRSGETWDFRQGCYATRALDSRRLPLPLARHGSQPVLKNPAGSLWDVGDGVCAAALATKANTIDPEAIALVRRSVEIAEADFRALVLYNEGDHFSLGANLFLVAMAAGQRDFARIRSIVREFQGLNQRLKYASIPVVAAPHGRTLGGGLELCLGAAGGVQAAAETYCGLVEAGVGLIPGGGGTLNLLWRALGSIPEGAKIDPLPLVTQVFTNIALARVATSAEEAQALGYFRPSDGITLDRARLLHDAKARAIGVAESGYHSPAPRAFVLPGEDGIATLKMMVLALQAGGQASEHDGKIALKLAEVLCGGVSGAAAPVTEETLLDLECEAFLSLCGESKTQERMQYMLLNNKPLRN